MLQEETAVTITREEPLEMNWLRGCRALNVEEALKRLLDPFDPNDLEWRADFSGKALENTEEGKEARVRALAYVSARAIMTRLDEVLGPENWREAYEVITLGQKVGMKCTLLVRFPGTGKDEWVSKEGVAEPTQVEPLKGAESDSLKRAAVKLGIGRYLYSFPDMWCKAVKKGKALILRERPAVPRWAYPSWWGDRIKEDGYIVLSRNLALGDEAPTETGLRIGEVATDKGQRLATSEVSSAADSAADTNNVSPSTGPVPDDEKLQRARGYLVPKGRGLPGEEKSLGDLVDQNRTLAIHLFRIIQGDPSLNVAKGFTPEGEEDWKLYSATRYLLQQYAPDVLAKIPEKKKPKK